MISCYFVHKQIQAAFNYYKISHDEKLAMACCIRSIYTLNLMQIILKVQDLIDLSALQNHHLEQV